jgi:hypothetical protein
MQFFHYLCKMLQVKSYRDAMVHSLDQHNLALDGFAMDNWYNSLGLHLPLEGSFPYCLGMCKGWRSPIRKLFVVF